MTATPTDKPPTENRPTEDGPAKSRPTDKRLRGRLSKAKTAVVQTACRLAGCEEESAAPKAEVQLLQIGMAVPAEGHVGRSPGTGGANDGSGEPSVVVSNLSKVYPGGVKGADNVDLHAAPGEIVSVLGPNGAGKSTILNMIVGLIRPTHGEITVHGVPSTDVRKLARFVGVALQSTGLDPSMTAREHFEVQAALYGVPKETATECASALLAALGLGEYVDRQVVHFSIGLQRRLVLALALVHDPQVIVFDEPTAGLDPQSRRLMWELLERLRSEGRTIVFSTQILEEADVLAQRVYVIDSGRVVAQGPPAELRKAYGEHTLRVRIAGSLDRAQELIAAKLPELGEGRKDSDALVFTSTESRPDADGLMKVLEEADVELLELSVGRPSLEDAFVRLTGSAVRTEPLINANASGGPLCRCQ
ncbi:ABC transporter ATP-binding protein [Streptomyces vastus]|uniref:ATP-binding cassette domain-containing protein n=1 Tax=Streptomyces vastus TaxID=285451 RepID=A0ABP6CQH0_9ACTN